jgi:hypothetical protein
MGTAKRAELDIEPETSPWLQAHRALSQLAKERANADAEEGRCLLAALRAAAHLHLGFATFNEYIERSFGYKPRTTQEKLRVAEALEELPLLTQALQHGTVHWSAARELTRVAVPENESQWLALAQGKSVRQLEELVAGKAPGDDPSSAPRASERRHVLRFEVAPETFALFREALTALRRSTGAALDDDAALLALARLALGGPRDEGRASYQIAITVCAACGQGHQPAGGELVPIDPDIVAMAHCDGQHLGSIPPHVANDAAPVRDCDCQHLGGIPPHVADAAAPLGSPTTRHGAHVGVGLHPENHPARIHPGIQVPLPPPHAPLARAKQTRAKQTIPPALRRAVLARDHRRCRVPGCRNFAFLDRHHLQLRSEGGPNDAENLITLCGAHHRAAHRGQLLLDGTATTLRCRHADGNPYGRVVEPQALEARAKAFRALRSLGFGEAEVHAVLAQLHDELAAATTEQWLRAALALLTPPRSRR